MCKKNYRDQYYNAKDGCVELKLSSWKDFVDYIYFTDLDHSQYIWRGQRCENWPLKSARDRALDGINSGRDNGQRLRVPSLNDFKLAVRGRRGANPPRIDMDNDWWALGQHYGFITPLLDWTASPFVAAYFAFIEQGEEQTDYRAIYALHVSRVGQEPRAPDGFCWYVLAYSEASCRNPRRERRAPNLLRRCEAP